MDERLGRIEEHAAQADQLLERLEHKVELLVEKDELRTDDVTEVRLAQKGLKKRIIALEQKVA